MKYLTKLLQEIKLFINAIGSAQLTEGLSYFQKKPDPEDITFNDIRILIDGVKITDEIKTSFCNDGIYVKYYQKQNGPLLILMPNQHYKLSLQVKSHVYNLGYRCLLFQKQDKETPNVYKLKFTYLPVDWSNIED